MKHFYFIIFYLCSTFSFAQTLEWQWAKTLPCTTPDSYTLITTDNEGSIFTYSTFTKPSIVINGMTLTNHSNEHDAYFVKYNAEGEFQWVKQIGGVGRDYIHGLATDSDNNIYVTGAFKWGSLTFGNTTFLGDGFFIVKYDSDGNLLWARVGTEMTPKKLIVSDSGEIYLTGNFLSFFTYYGMGFPSVSGNLNLCILKLDGETGDAIWGKFPVTAPNNENEFNWPDVVHNIDIDEEGNLFIAGTFGSDYITFDDITLTNDYDNTMFVAKFDTTGNILWAKATGSSTCTNVPYAITADSAGNSYLGGQYCGTINFDGIELQSDNGKGFIYKFDSTGNAQWGKSIDGNSSVIHSFITDDGGNLYAGGAFNTPLDLGNIIIESENANFIAKYSPEGETIWAKATGKQNINSKLSLDISNSRLYAAGYLAYDSLMLDNINLTPDGNINCLFISRLEDETLLLPQYEKNTITIYPNPAAGQFIIKSDRIIKSVKVSDSNGKLVKEVYNTSLVNIADMSAGVYFATIEDALSNITTQKIIKQ